MKSFLLCLLLAGIVGCGTLPQKGGRSIIKQGDNTAELVQSENPKESSSQVAEQETIYNLDPETGKTNSIVVKSKTETSIGGAQKDTAREVAAKLKSMRPVQFLGLVLMLAALAMFHPVVRAITMSRTLQMVTGATGLFLVFAPAVIVGNEFLFIIGGLALPVIWFFVHRHGKLQAHAGDEK